MEKTPFDYKSDIIGDINQDLEKMTLKELGKVYRYVRTNIIADIPDEAKIKEFIDYKKEIVEVIDLIENHPEGCRLTPKGIVTVLKSVIED